MTDCHATISIDDERRAHLFRLAAVDPHDLTATRTATSANNGEQWRTSAGEAVNVKYGAGVGESPRTVADGSKVALKTTKVQAFGGSNPSPSARF